MRHCCLRFGATLHLLNATHTGTKCLLTITRYRLVRGRNERKDEGVSLTLRPNYSDRQRSELQPPLVGDITAVK